MAVASKTGAAESIYRRLLRGAAFLVLLGLVVSAAAQLPQTFPPEKKKERAARAVALIEWTKDSKGAWKPRLVPISFLWQEKFYDAGLYEASPLPLALWTGTVYEAQRSGVPAGLFTVQGGYEVRNQWYGVGQWSPGAKLTAAAAKSSADSGRPHLKRAAGASDEEPKPAASAAAPGASSKTPAASAPPKPEPRPEPNDPNRPRLHRGKPENEPEYPLPPSPEAAIGTSGATKGKAAGAPTATAKPGAPAKPGESREALVAVSDADSQEGHPYLFPWTRDEQERRTADVKALAEAAVAREAGEKVTLEDVQVRAYDLYLDNSPEIVLSARTTGGKSGPKGLLGQPRIYYVTVVARVTVSGETRKLLSSVTSSSWLGSVPRLEVVDAVDADGDGKGDLLFREVTESSHRYILYRVGRDELFPLVETGAMPND